MDEAQEVGWDDRLACAGIAFFVGAPTALLAWLVVLGFTSIFHMIPHFYWVSVMWGIFVVVSFLFPRLMDLMFSRVWEWVLTGIGLLLNTLMYR
jgi:hypothetical protein